MSENKRIIHISDLHFFEGAISWELEFWNSETECGRKFNNILSFLEGNKSRLGTNKVVITGDITDSGDEVDYHIAKGFLERLWRMGYQVYTIPGNHDCCYVGLSLLEGAERRQRFQDYVGYYNEYPQEIDKFQKSHIIDWTNYYPREISFGSLRLILLDSMHDEMNEDDWFAQGKLGENQLSKLKIILARHKEERIRDGIKVVVSIHHSPFQNINEETTMGLHDSEDFLGIISNKVDCLLFGHTGEPQEDFPELESRYGIPIVNCVNLQHSNFEIPISVIDLLNNTIEVFKTNTTDSPQKHHGNLPSGMHITPWVTRSDPVIYNYSDAAPYIKFQSGDRVSISIGGCVQTGGIGNTWKRYVNPIGENSDKLYFGQIYLPGITSVLAPLKDFASRSLYGGGYDREHMDKCLLHFIIPNIDSFPEPKRYLSLGYTDDNYADNGYWGHEGDNGECDQCKHVGPAYVDVYTKPIPPILSLMQYINQLKANPESGIMFLLADRGTKSVRDLLTYYLWTE